MDKQKLLDHYRANSGGYTGAISGFIISVMILLLGFFKALFIALCVGFGYYIGTKITSEKDYIKNLLDRILPPGTYR